MLEPTVGIFADYENLLADEVIGEIGPGFSLATPGCRAPKTAAKKES